MCAHCHWWNIYSKGDFFLPRDPKCILDDLFFMLNLAAKCLAVIWTRWNLEDGGSASLYKKGRKLECSSQELAGVVECKLHCVMWNLSRGLPASSSKHRLLSSWQATTNRCVSLCPTLRRLSKDLTTSQRRCGQWTWRLGPLFRNSSTCS